MKLVVRLIISTLAVFLADYLLDGVHLNQFSTAIIVAIVLALLNTFLKPVLVILTIPVTLMTLGLFYLAINAIIVLLASELVPGFQVDSFWDALLFSMLNTVIAWLMERLAGTKDDD